MYGPFPYGTCIYSVQLSNVLLIISWMYCCLLGHKISSVSYRWSGCKWAVYGRGSTLKMATVGACCFTTINRKEFHYFNGSKCFISSNCFKLISGNNIYHIYNSISDAFIEISNSIQQLYNIGWHWGLYENVLHASWWYSPSRYGEVNIIMTSAVYNRNKAIQYYYYYRIWSWLCSEILLFACTLFMWAYKPYNCHQHWHCLPKSSGLEACVGLPTPFSQIMVATTLLPLSNIYTLPGCLYIWWFLWTLLGTASENFMSRHRHSGKGVLFEHNSYTVGWTTVLRSGECWPKACGVLCSVKFSLNHFLWTLYVNTAFLRCVASGNCDECAGIKILLHSFVNILNG